MWIYLFLQRFTFAGAVCAGTYLTDEDYEKDPDVENGYVVTMGLFIKFFAFLWIFTFALILCLVGFVVLHNLNQVQNRGHREINY